MHSIPTMSGLYNRILSLEAHQGKIVGTPDIDELVISVGAKFNTLTATDESQLDVLNLLSDKFAELKNLIVTQEINFLEHTGNPNAHHTEAFFSGLFLQDFIDHTGNINIHHLTPDIVDHSEFTIHTGERVHTHKNVYFGGYRNDDLDISDGVFTLGFVKAYSSAGNFRQPPGSTTLTVDVPGVYWLNNTCGYRHIGTGIAVIRHWLDIGGNEVTGGQAFSWVSGDNIYNSSSIESYARFVSGDALSVNVETTTGAFVILTSGSCSLNVIRMGP